jgi:hypothetical protein
MAQAKGQMRSRTAPPAKAAAAKALPLTNAGRERWAKQWLVSRVKLQLARREATMQLESEISARDALRDEVVVLEKQIRLTKRGYVPGGHFFAWYSPAYAAQLTCRDNLFFFVFFPADSFFSHDPQQTFGDWRGRGRACLAA